MGEAWITGGRWTPIGLLRERAWAWGQADYGGRSLTNEQKELVTIAPGFECEYEMHERDAFQTDGHFVCGLRDVHGFRRDWEGNEVHVLTLRHQGQQVLRMMADTKDEAARLMCVELQSTFLALWTAQFLQGFNHEQFRRQNDRANELQAFIDLHYKKDIDSGRHGQFPDVYATAMYYLGRERRAKLEVEQ